MEKLISLIKAHRVTVIVIVSLLLISVTVISILLLTREEGNTVVVTIDNVIVGEYDLNKDGEHSLNGGTNTLTIKYGVAYMSYSSCPGHDCEGFGKIKYVGQSIVCLPNSIVITIEANENAPKTDEGVDFMS